jgi:hypothetical protein
MTRDDVIRMAREAGFEIVSFTSTPESLERFAALVAAAEREAILDLVFFGYVNVDLIRARGEK